MAWIEPKWQEKNFSDFNQEILDLKGTLEDEQARILLGKFLTYNLQFTVEILFGIKLHPRQAILLRSWFHHNYNMAIWSRGGGKSSIVGWFSVLYCLFNPKVAVLIVSQNFRSSRRILENLEKIIESKEGYLIKQCTKGGLSRRNDIFKYEFNNGSTLTAVPLSGGDGLRGLRCQVLIIDEAVLISEAIIETILKPFLVASGDIKQKLKLRELEEKLIKRGMLKEEDREVFASASKMILLSSASYQWEDLYKIYQKYLERIDKDTESDIKIASYCVTQISYKAVPEDLLDKGVIKDVEGGNLSQAIIDREYGAKFVSDSAGYFSAKKMDICTIKDGQRPTIEIIGEKTAEYVLGIDPSFSSAEHSDHFAMSLLKIIERKDGKRIGMLVHSYAVAGGDLKDHILYLYYLLTHFNIVYIGVDSTQGNNEFTTSANESKLFKNANLELHGIEADFGKDSQSEVAGQIRVSYNKTGGRIVQKQNFNSSFQRSSCEYLQSCLDHSSILFAGKACAVDGVVDSMRGDYPEILKEHKEFKDEQADSFISNQDFLIDLTKKECALIEVSTSAGGILSFDLPQSLRRSKSPTRARKDSFSSLMLANWCLKNYLASQDIKIEDVPSTFTPFAV